MENIHLYSRDLRSCKPLAFNGFNNGGMFFKYDDDLLIKIYGISIECFLSTFEYTVDRLLEIGRVDNAVMPLSKVYVDEKFSGICMPEIKNAKNLYGVIEDPNIPLNTRINYAKTLVSTLRNLHRHNVILGDMHLDNIILNEESIYFVDMDSARCKEDILLPSLYYLKQTPESPYIRVEDKMTDNIKMAIISLCLIYRVNFEQAIRDRKLSHYIMDDVRECLPERLKSGYNYTIDLDKYLDVLLNQVYNGNYEQDRNKILSLKDISRER